MAESVSIGARLRAGLVRTRQKISSAFTPSAPIDWEALEESLITADVGAAATTSILDKMREDSDRSGAASLRREILAVLGEVGPASGVESTPPLVKMLVGVNGVGKTTSVAKLAHRSIVSGSTAIAVAADTFRAAATEQLQKWGERVSVEVFAGEPGRDPASVVHDGVQLALSRGIDNVFVDTAGRLHTKKPLMDELQKIARVANRVIEGAPHETLLVMDATVGSNGLVQAREFQKALELTGIVLTKMDGTAKGGIVIAIARELGIPVRFIGVGESADDLLPFSPQAFVDSLFDLDNAQA